MLPQILIVRAFFPQKCLIRTQFERHCGRSRLIAGAHFSDSVETMFPLSHAIGQYAADWIQRYIDLDHY
jgi:hypothetical protein